MDRHLGWESLDARGTTGGMLLFWDTRVLERVASKVGSFSNSCLFRNYEDGFLWAFLGLYGPLKERKRRELWEELASIKGL